MCVKEAAGNWGGGKVINSRIEVVGGEDGGLGDLPERIAEMVATVSSLGLGPWEPVTMVATAIW